MPSALTRPVKRDAQFSYVLDCGVELGEITPLEASVFMADTPAALALSDALDSNVWPKHFMRNTARDYLGQLSKKQRLVWAIKGLEGMEYALEALRERMSFLLQQKVQADLGLQERVRIAWMDEASDDDAFESKLFESVHDITPERAMAFLSPKFEGIRAFIEEDLDLALEAIAWLKQPGARAEARELASQFFAVSSRGEHVLALPSTKMVSRVAAKKKRRNQARGAIKKALALFTSFGLEKNVQMLVSGQTVTLSHPDSPLKLEVAPLRDNWLEEKTVNPGGHVPFRLSVLTKEGDFLSRLCVLFDKTPVLDQLFALSMFVQTGNELELLKKANWFGYEDAAEARAILAEKAPGLVDKLPPSGSNRGNAFDRLANDMNRLEDHWAPYKAPVSNWLGEWFGPAAQTLQLLKSEGPVLALA